MDNLEKETKQIMKENGIYANKNLGQNFLINEDTVTSIVEKAEVSKEDGIIEIGPGLRNSYKVFTRKSWKSSIYRIR